MISIALFPTGYTLLALSLPLTIGFPTPPACQLVKQPGEELDRLVEKRDELRNGSQISEQLNQLLRQI